MVTDLFNLIILSGAFLVLFALGELGYRVFNIQAEYTRKFIHAGTGVLTLLFPLMLTSHWSVLMICSSFLLILLASWKWNILPSINAIDRFSLGSLLYPVTVYVLFYLYSNRFTGSTPPIVCFVFERNVIWFYLPILILAFADPAAALIGRRFPLGKYKVRGSNKTLMGSAAFAITAFLLSFFLIQNYMAQPEVNLMLASIAIAISCSIVEAMSSDGVDNLTIPVTAYIVMDLLM